MAADLVTLAMPDRLQAAAAILASLLVLFTAMIDPRLAFALAGLSLVALVTVTFVRRWRA